MGNSLVATPREEGHVYLMWMLLLPPSHPHPEGGSAKW